jgi:hypothetical protein
MGNAKAEAGDTDGAIAAFVRAYAYVPDGKEVKVQKTKSGRFAYQYVDNVTGKIISKGMMTPEEMLSVATKGHLKSDEDLALAERGPASPATVEALRGAPGGQGATAGGSDPAGNSAGSQPRYDRMPASEAFKVRDLKDKEADDVRAAGKDQAAAVKDAKKAEADAAKVAKADEKAAKKAEADAAKVAKADAKDAARVKADVDKAATSQRNFDQKRLDRAQELGNWTKENPAAPTTRAEFDQLPVGAWFVNPKDGKVGPKKAKAQPAAAQ